jgi:hypothetical protein
MPRKQHYSASAKNAYPKETTVPGTDLVIAPATTEIIGGAIDLLPRLRTNAKTDRELLRIWLKAHADNSASTHRLYTMIGERFLAGLKAAGRRVRDGVGRAAYPSLVLRPWHHSHESSDVLACELFRPLVVDATGASGTKSEMSVLRPVP